MRTRSSSVSPACVDLRRVSTGTRSEPVVSGSTRAAPGALTRSCACWSRLPRRVGVPSPLVLDELPKSRDTIMATCRVGLFQYREVAFGECVEVDRERVPRSGRRRERAGWRPHGSMSHRFDPGEPARRLIQPTVPGSDRDASIKRVCICGSGVAVLASRRRRRSSITSEVMDGRVPRAKVAGCPSRSQHRVREICCGSGGSGAT
jgi:hypothetical protein